MARTRDKLALIEKNFLFDLACGLPFYPHNNLPMTFGGGTPHVMEYH
jgi:hypothetical protein